MTRGEQNTLIINSITDKLKDLPNVQQIISSKFDEWFRSLVATGTEILMGQAQAQAAAKDSGGGGEGGGEAAAPAG